MTRKQAAWLTIIVALLLLGFLFYYYKMRNKKEKCPDGSDVPEDGNCVALDSKGDLITQAPGPADDEGCIRPSVYVKNVFPLSLGMMGVLVEDVQKGLNLQFGTKLVPDGKFGCATLSALKKYLGVTTVDTDVYKDKILTPKSIQP